MSEKLYPNITPFSLDWYSEVLTSIRDIILEDREGLKAVVEAVGEWEKNVDTELKEKLWEIKKKIWRERAEKYGWDYVSTAVVRDFAKELAKVVYDGNIGKVAEIFRLLELALERNKGETVQLLIEYIERFHGDIETLMGRLREIISNC
jgi:hypothetical protein